MFICRRNSSGKCLIWYHVDRLFNNYSTEICRDYQIIRLLIYRLTEECLTFTRVFNFIFLNFKIWFHYFSSFLFFLLPVVVERSRKKGIDHPNELRHPTLPLGALTAPPNCFFNLSSVILNFCFITYFFTLLRNFWKFKFQQKTISVPILYHQYIELIDQCFNIDLIHSLMLCFGTFEVLVILIKF